MLEQICPIFRFENKLSLALKKLCFQTEILGKFILTYIFSFILSINSSSSCEDQFAIL